MVKLKKVGTTKKAGAPKKAAKKVNKALADAEKLVEQYEEKREELEARRSSFEEDFPEAQLAINDIKSTEDEVISTIAAAKTAVRGAGQTIGDFRFVPKSTSAGHLPDKVLELLCQMSDDDAGEALKALYSRGVISSVKVDKDASRMVKTSVPDLAEMIEDAWDAGGKPLTPTIFTPKM